MIGDGERHDYSEPQPGSKAALRNMLAQALANTGAMAAEPMNRIEPEREQKLTQALAGGASVRDAMKVAGVAKGTVTRFKREALEAAHDEPPTAHQVAMAIVSAARELGTDPERIAMGEIGRGGPNGDLDLSRARAYAAFAIREVFPRNGAVSIARWVNAGSPSCYLASLEYQRKLGRMKWWDDESYQHVVQALRQTI